MKAVHCLGVGAVFLAAACPAAAAVSIAPFGTSASGEQVQLVTLTNRTGMRVRISTRGGAITEIMAPDRTGKFANVVLGRPDFAAWEKAGGFNAITGRYANRIDKGGFTIDGTFYKLPGANPTTGVTIHGGPNGFANRIWKAEPLGASGVTLTYVSADGENGFPGELTTHVAYTLTDSNVLRLVYTATTTKPTVVNLTNHAYFTIGGHAAGPVNDQMMQIFATSFTPNDERTVPTGEIRPVVGTAFDFRTPRRVGEALYSPDNQIAMARGIDHNFVLDKPAGNTSAPTLAARLTDAKSGRRLEVRTTEPGVQVYSSNGFNGGTAAENGIPLRQGDALAFETQHYPDSPNHPNFPSTVLRPGQTFHSITEFAFSTDARAKR